MTTPTHARGTISTTGNRYCGPYALAHLLGLPDSGQAAALIQELRKRDPQNVRQVVGVYCSEVLAILKQHGMVPTRERFYSGVNKSKPTVAQWLRDEAVFLAGSPVLLHVTGHFIVVDGDRIYDNGRPEGRTWKEWPGLRKRVCNWWSFPRRLPTPASPKPAPSQTCNVFRLSCPISAKTGKPVWVMVNKDGSLSPKTQKEVNLSRVGSWREIRAGSWKEARERVEAGEGSPCPYSWSV